MATDTPLADDSALVQAAKGCEFMLPETLTIGSLRETVDRKIANVSVLLERARKHDDLPTSAQTAAEQEYTATEDDYALNKREQHAQEQERQLTHR
jgi:hypothetical protein